MAVECTSGDVHVTVQKIITISEPVTDISVTGCYAAAQSFHATNCKALHGGAFHIEMELKAGKVGGTKKVIKESTKYEIDA